MTKHYARVTVSVVVAALLVLVDQLIKGWAQEVLVLDRITVIPNLFYLTYVQNYGAAFGILQGQTILLSIMVILVVVAALAMLFSGRVKQPFLIWSISLVLAGGVGNLIDRLHWGYVVDYLDFSALFGFPVFNFADCCVVVGTFLILIYMLFLDREKTSISMDKKEA